MKNARIFLAFLLIMSLLVFAGCAGRDTTNGLDYSMPNTDNTIRDDLNRTTTGDGINNSTNNGINNGIDERDNDIK